MADYGETPAANRAGARDGNPVLTHISDYDIFTDVPVSQDGLSKEGDTLQEQNLEAK